MQSSTPFRHGPPNTCKKLNDLSREHNTQLNQGAGGLLSIMRGPAGNVINFGLDRLRNYLPVPLAVGTSGGMQLYDFEIAKDVAVTATTQDFYESRPVGTASWANGQNYAVGGFVKKVIGVGEEKTYICIVAHKSGGNQWQANVAYSLGDRVWNGTGPNNTTYKCTTETTGDAVFPVAKFTADIDEPENGAWATYWKINDNKVYVFDITGADAYVLSYAPIFQKNEVVTCCLDPNGDYYILAPATIRVGQQGSSAWNKTQKRLMHVYR